MVFQEHALLPWRTVLDNVTFGLENRGVARREREARAREMLALVGLTRFARHYPHQLSGGMKQRVGIARALANDPEVLLMDEPLAALDAQTRTIMQEELLRIWATLGKTVIYVTHSLEEALLLGDRVVLLTARPGRVSQIFPVDLGRPRGLEVRGSPAYGVLLEKIWSQLREEVVRAMAEEPAGTTERAGRPGWRGPLDRRSPRPWCSLIAWEWASATGLLREAFFPRRLHGDPRPPPPARGATARCGRHACATLARIGWAFALAAGARRRRRARAWGSGAGCARASTRSSRSIYPIPSVLFLPLVSFLVPRGETALVVTTAVTSFFLIAFTTTHGVRQIDRARRRGRACTTARGAGGSSPPCCCPARCRSSSPGSASASGYALIVVVAVEIVRRQPRARRAPVALVAGPQGRGHVRDVRRHRRPRRRACPTGSRALRRRLSARGCRTWRSAEWPSRCRSACSRSGSCLRGWPSVAAPTSRPHRASARSWSTASPAAISARRRSSRSRAWPLAFALAAVPAVPLGLLMGMLTPGPRAPSSPTSPCSSRCRRSRSCRSC